MCEWQTGSSYAYQYPHVINFHSPPSHRASHHDQVYSSFASHAPPPFFGERKLLLNAIHCVKASLLSSVLKLFIHSMLSALLHSSSVYSKEEIDSAIEIIKKQFALFEGCELHRLSYMTDEECNHRYDLFNRRLFSVRCNCFPKSYCFRFSSFHCFPNGKLQ